MSKELVDGQERFDGFPVTLYEGRFSGSFEIPEELGAKLEFDDVVSFVVTCTVGKATIDSTKLGDLKRINAMSVQNVAPASQKAVDEAFAANGLTLNVELPLPMEEQEGLGPDEPVLGTDEIFSPGEPADEAPTFEPVRPKVVPVDFTEPDTGETETFGDPLEKKDKMLAGFLEQN